MSSAYLISSILRGTFSAPSGGPRANMNELFGLGDEANFGTCVVVWCSSEWFSPTVPAFRPPGAYNLVGDVVVVMSGVVLCWSGDVVLPSGAGDMAKPGDMDDILLLRLSLLFPMLLLGDKLPNASIQLLMVWVSAFLTTDLVGVSCCWPGTGGRWPSGGVRAKTWKEIITYHLIKKTFDCILKLFLPKI